MRRLGRTDRVTGHSKAVGLGAYLGDGKIRRMVYENRKNLMIVFNAQLCDEIDGRPVLLGSR